MKTEMESRLLGAKHLPYKTMTRDGTKAKSFKCQYCWAYKRKRKYTSFTCLECKKHLCIQGERNCFITYHSKPILSAKPVYQTSNVSSPLILPSNIAPPTQTNSNNQCQKSADGTVSMGKNKIEEMVRPKEPLCVICQQNVDPALTNEECDENTLSIKLKVISDALQVFSTNLKSENFISQSSDLETLTVDQKLTLFCESCFSIGVQLSLMYKSLNQLEMEIRDMVVKLRIAISMKKYADDRRLETGNVDIGTRIDNMPNDKLNYNCDMENENYEDVVVKEEITEEMDSHSYLTHVDDSSDRSLASLDPDKIFEDSKPMVQIKTENFNQPIQLKELYIKLERLPEDIHQNLLKRINITRNKHTERKTKVAIADSAEMHCGKMNHKKVMNRHILDSSEPVAKLNAITKDAKSDKFFSKTQKKPFKSFLESIKAKSKSRSVLLSCTSCNLTFTSIKLHKSHLQDHRNENKPKKTCKTCGKTFNGVHAYKKHRRNDHKISKSVINECITCQEIFPSANDLQFHEMVHTGDVPYECQCCHETFTDMHAYANHQMHSSCPVNGNYESHECELCGKTFKLLHLLLAHKSEHLKAGTGGVGYECAVSSCRKKLTTMSSVRGHTLQFHCKDESPYSCDICGKPTRVRETLRSHRLSHSAIAKFPCSKCSQCFKSKKILFTHTIRHHPSEATLLKCHLCPKVFKAKQDLHRHVSLHAKSFICDVCGNAFNRNIDLKTHLRSHTGDLFPCMTCHKKFLTLYLLNQHISVTHFGRSKPSSGKKRGLMIENDDVQIN